MPHENTVGGVFSEDDDVTGGLVPRPAQVVASETS